MALYNSSNTEQREPKPKVTRQGTSKNTKLSASSRNHAKKKYRGQGR